MILHATHTHLYPGHRGTISGLQELADLHPSRECLVEFNDGSAATASISNAGNGWLLRVSSYRTAAGTDIVEKSWKLQIDHGDGAIRFHILGKVRTSTKG